VLAVLPKNRIIPPYRIPSDERTIGGCGFIKTGSLIRIPVISSTRRLAGFFCLNIAITDIGNY
jgi:hypothetical protein